MKFPNNIDITKVDIRTVFPKLLPVSIKSNIYKLGLINDS